jgi:hypothetical protein
VVIIRVNANLPAQAAQTIVEGIHTQAADGVIVLPHFCELLNEVPKDETIKVVQAANDCDTCAWKRCMHYKSTLPRINCPLWRAKV